MALVYIGQIITTLAGAQQICGDRGVVANAAQLVAAACQHVEGSFGLVQIFAGAVVGKPFCQGFVFVGGKIFQHHRDALSVRVDERNRRSITLARRAVAVDEHGDAFGVLREPVGECGFVVCDGG